MFQSDAGKKYLGWDGVAAGRIGAWSVVGRWLLASAMWVGLTAAQAESLPRLLGEALKFNPSVASSQARVRSAELGVESAEWQRYPTPFFNIEASGDDAAAQRDDEEDYVASIGVEQPLWTGGRLVAGVKKARAAHGSSLADAQAARQQVALDVIEAYGGWLSAQLKYQAWAQSRDTHEALREKVRRRAEQGVSSASDLALADGRLASTRADLNAAKAQEHVARLALARLLGRSIKTAIQPSSHEEAPQLQHADVNALLRQAQSQSPSVSRATAELAVIDAEIGESESNLWPDVYLRLEYRHNGQVASNGERSSGARVSLGMRSKLGAGFSSLTNIGALQAQHAAVLTDIEIQKRFVDEQVSADLAMLRSFIPRLKALRLSLEVAETVSESYGRQFLAGRKSWLNVMNAARDLVNTEVQLGDAAGAALAVSWRLAVVTRGIDAVLRDIADDR